LSGLYASIHLYMCPDMPSSSAYHEHVVAPMGQRVA
jgi:hypothetical protein